MRLYINGQLVDMYDNTVIAQTKQVNDIASIETRNSNFTNSFSIPKTAKNLKLMQFMSVPGSYSTTPYQKNSISLYSDSGECFIKNGWAVFSDNGDSYTVAIVDGIIDFYKTIENKTLSDIVGEDFNHEKNVDNVVLLWENIAPYAYIVADYNGNNGDTSTGSINIDYLVPAVRVSELWFRMFQQYGMQYSGAVFSTFNFQNLWLTFPKAPQYTSIDTNIFVSDGVTANNINGMYPIIYGASVVNNLQGIIGANRYLQVAETAKYKLHFTGTLSAYAGSPTSDPTDGLQLPVKISVYKNTPSVSAIQAFKYTTPEFLIIKDNIPFGSDIDVYSEAFDLNQNDAIALAVRDSLETGYGTGLDFSSVYADIIFYLDGISTIQVELIKVESNVIDFQTAFSDFSLKDFSTEIVQRFGLTIFKDKQTGRYDFLTLQEVLQDTDVIDWSDKFIDIQSENYSVGSYAQKNFYRYRYNDNGGSYSDSCINVFNTNLNDTKDLFVSKIYSPERNTSTILNTEVNVYKMWDKEIKDDSTVDYKPKDNRYYFLRATDISNEISVYSTGLSESPVTATHYFRESFYKLSFFDIIQEYYSNITRILDQVKVDKVSILLHDTDVINLDFRKLVYIKQLSNYFIVNKIENYVPGKPTTVELTRVIYSEAAELLTNITITDIYPVSGQPAVAMPFITNYIYGTLKAQYSFNNTDWIEAIEGFVGNVCNVLVGILTGVIYFRIIDTTNNVTSNTVSITL